MDDRFLYFLGMRLFQQELLIDLGLLALRALAFLKPQQLCVRNMGKCANDVAAPKIRHEFCIT